MEHPLVSCILLAGRAHQSAIKLAIKSFQSQTYPYKELIIVNNATSQFAASGLNLMAQPNIAIVDTPTEMFAGMARNVGISSANGQIIAQFDADYWYAPERLEGQINAMATHGATVSVLTHTLRYSLLNGRTGYQKNDRNAILNTMVFARPLQIDYPGVDKQEELGILDRFRKAGASMISIPAPQLACKLWGAGETAVKPKFDGLEKEHQAIVRKIYKSY